MAKYSRNGKLLGRHFENTSSDPNDSIYFTHPNSFEIVLFIRCKRAEKQG